MFIIML